jgi:holo-[acyl-carrier protein] synthase
LIHGIGTDILQIKRIADMSKKMGWALAHQTLGHRELQVYAEMVEDRLLSVNYLARRFAAKEAFVKACGIDKLDVRQVEILNHDNGAPYIALTGRPYLQMGSMEWVHHVTISDSDEYVTATVICERNAT